MMAFFPATLIEKQSRRKLKRALGWSDTIQSVKLKQKKERETESSAGDKKTSKSIFPSQKHAMHCRLLVFLKRTIHQYYWIVVFLSISGCAVCLYSTIFLPSNLSSQMMRHCPRSLFLSSVFNHIFLPVISSAMTEKPRKTLLLSSRFFVQFSECIQSTHQKKNPSW